VTEAQYRARIKAMGLERLGSSRGEHTMHRKDGVIYPIKDPESLTPEQRVEAIAKYEMEFGSP
jgi:hypothetical protein